MNPNESYMLRCLELAAKGLGTTAPNPMVGSVLVHENRIIGEGYHQVYGGPHAEVNCIASVKPEDRHLIPSSTLYVSLEPCAHFGKTPPCSDLIIDQKIHKVVVGCRDPFVEVNGKGIEKIRKAGIEVVEGVLEQECRNLNHRFFTFHQKKRPWIILKWAQSADGFIAANTTERTFISNELSNQWVHKWRAEEAAILVGSNTAIKDRPSLTTRLWQGKNPVKVLIDASLKVSSDNPIFKEGRILLLNKIKEEQAGAIEYKKSSFDPSPLPDLMNIMYQENLNSVLIEGGANTLQQFINAELWDEARIITNSTLHLEQGVKAPVLGNYKSIQQIQLKNDSIEWFYKDSN